MLPLALMLLRPAVSSFLNATTACSAAIPSPCLPRASLIVSAPQIRTRVEDCNFYANAKDFREVVQMARTILKAQVSQTSKRSKPEPKVEARDGTGFVQLCCLAVLGAISSACRFFHGIFPLRRVTWKDEEEEAHLEVPTAKEKGEA